MLFYALPLIIQQLPLCHAQPVIRSAGLKLLIADDNEPMRQTLRALLSPIASDIREATDGEQAERLFAEQQPDWVVMDVQMKPVNGLAATRAIRRRFPSARVVIVTHCDDSELRAEAARAGACAYVLKDDLAALPQLLAAGAADHG
jgi:DNA-binding NarL/FixJ family response regulator